MSLKTHGRWGVLNFCALQKATTIFPDMYMLVWEISYSVCEVLAQKGYEGRQNLSIHDVGTSTAWR